jgi:hypothetical protein
MTMLRDWQDYHERQPAGLPEAMAFKAAALEIERLRRLLKSCRAAMSHSNEWGGVTDWKYMIADIDRALEQHTRGNEDA